MIKADCSTAGRRNAHTQSAQRTISAFAPRRKNASSASVECGFPCQKTAKPKQPKANNPMYNQYEGLAYIAITPALQAGLREPPVLPDQVQVADYSSSDPGLISCPGEAGDQSGCQNPAKPASKMPSGSCITIPLTKGLYATIDAADLDVVSQYSWAARMAAEKGETRCLR